MALLKDSHTHLPNCVGVAFCRFRALAGFWYAECRHVTVMSSPHMLRSVPHCHSGPVWASYTLVGNSCPRIVSSCILLYARYPLIEKP
jgi:hypothetical protein